MSWRPPSVEILRLWTVTSTQGNTGIIWSHIISQIPKFSLLGSFEYSQQWHGKEETKKHWSTQWTAKTETIQELWLFVQTVLDSQNGRNASRIGIDRTRHSPALNTHSTDGWQFTGICFRVSNTGWVGMSLQKNDCMEKTIRSVSQSVMLYPQMSATSF